MKYFVKVQYKILDLLLLTNKRKLGVGFFIMGLLLIGKKRI